VRHSSTGATFRDGHHIGTGGLSRVYLFSPREAWPCWRKSSCCDWKRRCGRARNRSPGARLSSCRSLCRRRFRRRLCSKYSRGLNRERTGAKNPTRLSSRWGRCLLLATFASTIRPVGQWRVSRPDKGPECARACGPCEPVLAFRCTRPPISGLVFVQDQSSSGKRDSSARDRPPKIAFNEGPWLFHATGRTRV
jgi:hypothetical protein